MTKFKATFSTLALACTLASTATFALATPAFYAVVPVSTPEGIKGSTLALTQGPLPESWVSEPFVFDFKPMLGLNGGASPVDAKQVSWSVASGSLPAGLSLSADGVLAGVPTTAAQLSEFVVQANYRGLTARTLYSLKVNDITLMLSGAPLPDGALAIPYLFDFKPLLEASGPSGTELQAASWRIVQGALPAGLSLSAEGVLSGTPSAESGMPTAFTIEANYRSATIQRVYQFPAVPGFALGTAKLPTGEQGYAYRFDFKPLISAGGAPGSPSLLQGLSWAVVSGALPAGLSLSTSGVLSGTPSKVVVSSVTVQAQYGSANAQQTFAINVPSKQISGYVENKVFFSRGRSNASCWTKWNWGGAAVTQSGLQATSISNCYVDYGGYRYRPYGGLVKTIYDGYQNYDYYGVSRQPY